MRSRDWVHGVRIANYPQGRIHLRRARGLGAADGFICTSANGEELIEDKLNPAVKGGRRVVYPVLGLPVGQYPPPRVPDRAARNERSSDRLPRHAGGAEGRQTVLTEQVSRSTLRYVLGISSACSL